MLFQEISYRYAVITDYIKTLETQPSDSLQIARILFTLGLLDTSMRFEFDKMLQSDCLQPGF